MAMSNKDIRDMKREGSSLWEILSAVVQSGVEFPDASFKVKQELGLDQIEVEDMERDYDEIC